MSRQFVIVAELDRCIGCRGCEVACKWENDVPLGVSRCRSYTMGPTGTFPKLNMYFLPLMCQQCENPACADACPTGACAKSGADGVVYVDAEKCVGCGACVRACPYHACGMNREKNIMEKCDLCAQSSGGEPACVKNCAGGALHYGDVSDPDSGVSMLLRANEEYVFALKDEKAVRPSGRFILKKNEWIDILPFELEKAMKEGRFYDEN